MAPFVDDVPAVERDIRREAQALFDERVATLPDKQARVILAMCSLVLASYRAIHQRTRDPNVLVQLQSRAGA
jgi:hypothetical protein